MSDTSELLSKQPYFKGLNPADLKRIVGEVTTAGYSAGEMVFLEGEPCKGLYLVKSGQIRVFKSSPEGREQVMMVAGPGDSFNDVPIFDDGPNPASASAINDSTVFLVPKEAVLSAIGDNAPARATLRMFAIRLRKLTLMVEDLSLRTVVSRLARLLLEQATAPGKTTPARGLTQAEMATMIGSVRDVVGRALKQLEKIGAIRIKRARIMITNPDKLRDLL